VPGSGGASADIPETVSVTETLSAPTPP
jgi:hypothetical protein